MIILDKPYVSPLLEKTIVKNQIPVLVNNSALQLEFDHQMKKLDDEVSLPRPLLPEGETETSPPIIGGNPVISFYH